MSETIQLTAFLVASQLDLKGIKTFLDIKPLADTSSELFYHFNQGKYQYFSNYGVMVFAGYTEEEMKWGIKAVSAYQRNPLQQWLRDSFRIHLVPGQEPAFSFEEMIIDKADHQVMRIAMLSMAQSVALDHYHGISENLLAEVKTFTRHLEETGKLKIGHKNMMRFLGRALNTQNDIAENIYIFDAPDLVWDNEKLDKLHQGLTKHFDLRVRFSEIEYTMRIIQDNLVVFRDLVHQRESNLLEYVIIVLILVEVFNLFITKILD